MRILTVSEDFFPSIGGIAAHVQGLSAALRRGGHDVRVLTRRRLPPGRNLAVWRRQEFAYDGVPVTALPIMYSPRNALLRLQLTTRFAGAAARAARSMPADVVTFHHYYYDPDVVAAQARHRPVVFTNHSSQFLDEAARDETVRRRLLARFAFAHAVIAPSAELVEATRACGFPADRVHYVPNGVDPERFAPRAEARADVGRALGLDATQPIVLCARRPVPKNGVAYFVAALERLAAAGRACTVLFAGLAAEPQPAELEYTTALRRAVLALPPTITVRLLGSVPNDRMPALHAAADLAVLPSLLEATSIAGLETMASGTPLVGTTVGGIPEIVAHGETGLLVPPRDPAALAEALSWLLDDAARRDAMGAAARARVLREFSWEAVAERSLRVYERAAEDFRRRGSAPRRMTAGSASPHGTR